MSTAVKPETMALNPSIPQDIDSERRVLGILIKHPQKIDHVMDQLRDYHFYDPANRVIFQAIFELYQQKGKVSYVRLFDKLRRDKLLADPEQALMVLTESFVSKTELDPCLEILRDKYVKRRLLEASEAIEQMVLQETEESSERYLARAQEIIFSATMNELGGEAEAKDLMDILGRCYTNLIERKEGKTPPGLTVRFPSIDMITTGLKKKDLIILAGRPSMGKTSLALNFAVNVARREIPVLIFSLEMDDEQIGDRLVQGEFFRLRDETGNFLVQTWEYTSRLSEEKLALVQEIYNELYRLPIFVVDKRGMTTTDIRAKARKVKAERPDLGLIIIDYLQLIRVEPSKANNKSWALQVGDMVREIRDLAGELDVPVILLSQLNRGVESRENKRPMMSDLRDSGNIEEFADVVMFIYRDEYYYPDEADERGSRGKAEVIFAKQRKGATGTAVLRFYPEFTRFVDETDREV